MKRFNQLAILGLLIWYSAILWHNTLPDHSHQASRHHHHPSDHHHGLLSIIVDLIQDLHHNQGEGDRSVFFRTDFNYALKKFNVQDLAVPNYVSPDSFVELTLSLTNNRPWDPPPNFSLRTLTYNLSRRGPPVFS